MPVMSCATAVAEPLPVTEPIFEPVAVLAVSVTSPVTNPVTGSLKTTEKLIGEVPVGSAWLTA